MFCHAFTSLDIGFPIGLLDIGLPRLKATCAHCLPSILLVDILRCACRAVSIRLLFSPNGHLFSVLVCILYISPDTVYTNEIFQASHPPFIHPFITSKSCTCLMALPPKTPVTKESEHQRCPGQMTNRILTRAC